MSRICDEYGLKPTVDYRWQKQFFEQGAVVFQRSRNSEVSRLKRQVAALEEKVTSKNEVVAELMDEYVAVRKRLGRLADAAKPPAELGTRALARGCGLAQHLWYVLLPLQHLGWLQSLYRALGHTRGHDRR